MIEKIGLEQYKAISKPAENVIYFLEGLKKWKSEPIAIAEIGIGIGATSVEIAKRLCEKDEYYFFSYAKDVNALEKDLREIVKTKGILHPIGNTECTFDSYVWNLAKLAMDANNKNGLFDLVYLDGAHTFLHDSSACILLKKLVSRGGIIIFDDVQWTFSTSFGLNPTKRPETKKEYSQEQIETPQIKMVIELFMEDDPEFERIGEIGWQAVYRRR